MTGPRLLEVKEITSLPGLFQGDEVHVEGSYEGGQIIGHFNGTVIEVKRSGTVIVDDAKETDGAGTPIRHYVSRGTIWLRSILNPLPDSTKGETDA